MMVDRKNFRNCWVIVLGALIWVGSVWATSVWADSEQVTPPAEAQIHRMAQDYYATKGEWAGNFVIARVIQTRLEQKGNRSITAHLKYEAEFIQSRQHKSVDQRTFELVWQDDQWRVVSMGAHQSGRF